MMSYILILNLIMMVDLNLVKVFVTIFDTKSVSLAAERLNITQPSVSHNLSRLRYIFKNQLFTRTKEGMIPTFYAIKLYEVLNNPLLEIENAIQDIKAFDYKKSDTGFKLALADSDGINIIPVILSGLEKIAPNITLEIIPLEKNKISDWLASGKIDAAICHKLIDDQSLSTFKLFREKYICLVGNKNRILKQGLTLHGFSQGNHAIISNLTVNHLIDADLARQGLRRKIKLRIPQSSILQTYIEKNNLIITVPFRVGHYFKLAATTNVFDLPIDLPAFEMTLYWHKKTRDIQAHKWLIGFLKDALADT